MVYRDTLMVFLNKYFSAFTEKAKKDPWCANGIQLDGKDEIRKIALGVSANLEFFQKAVKREADCLLVHHSLSLQSLNQRIDPLLKDRIKYLLDHGLTLIGYHFLLDHHPEIGNNALVIKKLGGELVEPFSDEWGWIGELKEKTLVTEILKNCKKIYDHEPYIFLKGPKKIKRFAVLSGAGAPHSAEMVKLIDSKIELLITGEVKESTSAFFTEGKVNFASFGHYNTEKLGVKALGDVIKAQFYVDVEFIETPNEL
ncbi:MAG: Nif3-like dinuclear metal center hexameric protein [Patescibacteria group bacterium]